MNPASRRGLATDAIFAVGGDGTAMQAAGEAAVDGPPVGIIPAGTGNQLARHFGIPRHAARAVRALLGGVERRVDVGRLADGRRFALTAGFGFDVAIIANVPSLMDDMVATGPNVQMDDGLLDLCVFDAPTALDAVSVMWRCARRDFRPHRGLLCARGRDIRIETIPSAVGQADGDLLPQGVLRARVEPGGGGRSLPRPSAPLIENWPTVS